MGIEKYNRYAKRCLPQYFKDQYCYKNQSIKRESGETDNQREEAATLSSNDYRYDEREQE